MMIPIDFTSCRGSVSDRARLCEGSDHAVPRRAKKRRGAVLVLVACLMVGLFGVLAFAVDLGYLLHVRTELQRTADASALAAAAQLPEQEMAAAAARLATTSNSTCGATSDVQVTSIQFGFWDRDWGVFHSPVPTGRSINAVRVLLSKTNLAGNPVQLFFARVLGTTKADVTATATAIYDNWLCGPFVGIDSISVPGTPRTDSYDSTMGGYAWGQRDRGSICSDGPINVDGAALVRGDARAGKGYTVTLTGGAVVTRSIGSRLKPLNMPPVDASQAALVNNNANIPMIPTGKSWVSPVDGAGNFLLDGSKQLTLPAGTYYFNNFTITGQSVLNISGPTKIYITGNLTRQGGATFNNNTAIPANLQILMTGGTALVTSTNNLHGVIYAPNTAVTIDGSSDLFGAVVGKTLTITGSGAAHYDESLHLDNVEFPTRTALVD